MESELELERMLRELAALGASGDARKSLFDHLRGIYATGYELKWSTGTDGIFYSAASSVNGADKIWNIGYNCDGLGNPLNPAEPALFWQFESEFNNLIEWFVQYRSANGSVTRRPLGGTINRTTHGATVQLNGLVVVAEETGEESRLQVLQAPVGTATSVAIGTATVETIARFEKNNAAMIMCRNAASSQYLELMRLNADDTLVLGQSGSLVKGVAIPKLTGAQRDAIVTPEESTLIYNSDTNKLNFYNGTAWEVVTSA